MLTLQSTNFFGLIHYGTVNATTYWISRIEIWMILFIAYLFSLKVEKTKFLWWPEQKRKPLFYLISLVILLVAVLFVGFSITMIGKNLGLVRNSNVMNQMTQIMCENKFLLLFTCLTAGFTEEFIFRGFLLPRFKFLFNNATVSIILSSLLFGLAHIQYFDIIQILIPFGIGLIFSIFYNKYRCLSVLIVCHFLVDLISLYGACK
jgi:hypothetical protein